MPNNDRRLAMSEEACIDQLLLNLDEERQAISQVQMENGEIESSIKQLEAYLRKLDVLVAAGSAEENEWRMRYELGKCHRLHLSEHQTWLERELEETKWKLETNSYPDVEQCDLEKLSSVELIQLVRHLERIKRDYHTSVCAADYKLEKETLVEKNEFQYLDGMRRKFNAELRHDFEEMNELAELQTEAPSPITPSSLPFLQWLSRESHTVINAALRSDRIANQVAEQEKQKEKETKKKKLAPVQK